MNDTLVIYHSADLDGICSREIARRALPGATLLGYDYGRPVPDLSSYETVYLMDISLPVEVMREHAAKTVLIDHHRTCIEAVQPFASSFKGYYCIDGVAACRLAWVWFNGEYEDSDWPGLEEFRSLDVDEPYAVQLLGRYDVWDRAGDENVDLFQLGMQAQRSPDWDTLLSMDDDPYCRTTKLIDEVIENGRAIQSYLDVTNAQISRERGLDVRWEGLRFRALNTPVKGSLQFAAAIRPEHDGCLGYFWDGGKWRFSLYGVPHKPDLNLSTIAKRYGGGGHPQACGGWFKDGLLPELGGPRQSDQSNPIS